MTLPQLSHLPQLKGKKFKLVSALTQEPISNKVGNFDEIYEELLNFVQSQGISENAIDIIEIK